MHNIKIVIFEWLKRNTQSCFKIRSLVYFSEKTHSLFNLYIHYDRKFNVQIF